MKKTTRRSFSLALITGALGATGLEALALPIDRARGRQNARASRQAGRQTSRARRRHYWGLPPGYRMVRYGAYNYYFAGGIYYYPYSMHGRTCYIQVDIHNGHPAPPPPASQVYAEINIY